MAKKKQHIDDLFRNHLEGADLPLEGGEWDAIFSELHPKKKRRGWWFWLLLGIGLIVSSAAVVFLIPEGGTKPVNSATSIATSNEKNTQTVDEKTLQIVTESNKNTQVNTVAENQGDSETSRVQKDISEEYTTTQKTTSLESPVNYSYNDLKTPVVSPTEIKTNALIVNELKLFPLKSRLLKGIPYTLKHEEINTIGLDKNQKRPGKYLPLSVGIVSTLSSTSQSINTSGGIGEDYIRYREQNEQNGISYSTHLELKTRIKSIGVKSGIGVTSRSMTTTNQDFTYQIYDSIPFLNPDGDTLSFLPFNYRDTTINGLSAPSYTYLSIPLGLSKRVQFSPRWAAEVGASTNLRWALSVDGNSTNSNGGLSPVVLDQLNRFLVSGVISIKGYYTLAHKWQLEMGANYQQDLSNMLKSENVSQKMRLPGVHLGLHYQLK